MTRKKPVVNDVAAHMADQIGRLLTSTMQEAGMQPVSKRQRRPKQPPPDPNADLLRAAMPQLVFAFLTVADLLDPAGARRRQEQADPQPQRRRQRRTR